MFKLITRPFSVIGFVVTLGLFGYVVWGDHVSTAVSAIRFFTKNTERPAATQNLETSPPATETVRAAAFPTYKTYAFIVLLCLIWPWLMLPWMKSAIAEDSNAATLKVLIGILVVPVIAFALFLCYHGHSAMDVTLQTLLLGLFLFFYTAWCVSKVQTAVR